MTNTITAHKIIEGDFPFEEIRDDVVGGNGDYFATWQAAKDAGYGDDQIWSVTHGEEDALCYGPPHHYVNLVGFIATTEKHDGATYYIETWESDEPCAGCGDPDCDFDCDGNCDEEE